MTMYCFYAPLLRLLTTGTRIFCAERRLLDYTAGVYYKQC